MILFYFIFKSFSFKITSENEARALICLVYEDDRCLLHVGLIKIVGIQSLLKLPTGSLSHHRGKLYSFDLLQIIFCFYFFRFNSNKNLYNSRWKNSCKEKI
jgi:hypothetical protein